MSQYPPADPIRRPTEDANPLGLAGFIVSLVGLVACGGAISPIGLIMSLVALGRQPRGFAIAGAILGAIGSIWFIIVFLVIGLGVILAIIAAALGLGLARLGEDAIALNNAIEEHYRQHGQVPASLDELTTVQADTLTDPWGGAFRYEPIEGGVSFYLRSDGPDRQTGTDDDVELWRRFGDDADVKFKWGQD